LNLVSNRRIFKNVMYLNFSAIAAKVLGFATSILLARQLGETQFGQYMFIFSFTSYFLLFNDLGLNILNSRDVARSHGDAPRYFNEIGSLKLIITSVLFAVFLFTIYAIPYPQLMRTALMFGFLYIAIKSFGVFFGSFLTAFERLDINSILDFCFTLTVLLFLLAATYLKIFNLVSVMALYALAIFLWAGAFPVILFRRFIPFKLYFKPDFSLVKESYVFALGGIAGSVMMQTDVVVLKFMSGDAATGYYGIGLSFVIGLMFLGLSLSSAMYPVFSRLFKESREELKGYFEKSVETLYKMTVPFCVGGIVLAKKIILLFYGVSYLPAQSSFEILMLAGLLLAPGNFMATFLQATNRQGSVLKVNFIGIAVNLALSVTLIYYFSHTGAAVARAATFLYLAVCYWFIIRKDVPGVKMYSYLFKPVFAGLVMAAVLLSLLKLNVFILLFIGITVYLSVLVLVKGISREEYNFVKSCWRYKADVLEHP